MHDTSPSASSPLSAWRTHGLLFLLAFLYADNFIGRQIVAVMIEPIRLEFGASDTSMGLISGLAFAAVFAVLGLPAGRLADRMPRTRLLALSSLCWGIATILCALSGNFVLLVVARMLVAAVEAPGAPASLSLIADLYPPQRRAFAISCFTAAPTFAAILALSLGAWLVDQYGWRTSFVIVGTPALLISALLAFTTREPARGTWDGGARVELSSGLLATVGQLWAHRPVRYLILASAVATLGGNAFGMWNATFLVRSHGLELRHAGLLTGLIGGTAAGLGVLFSGWLTDHLGKRNPHWRFRIPLVGHLVGLVTLAAYLSWPSDVLTWIAGVPVPTAMLWCGLNGFFMVWWLGPSFSMLTTLVAPANRAVAMALQTMLSTLCGVGLGPVLTGALSDLLQTAFGIESLRYALFFSCAATSMAIVLFLIMRASLLRKQAAPCAAAAQSAR
ncbi:MFS transporter [Thauera sp.]|uniref:spinster family MFS transporter n=1 Tax=Thauera sp. TaxID=1905334 RepID=UPI002C9BF8A8|nr:MFS transporter [Thauera sp.]HRP26348.1 MFS transporter [Thauera sp.]